MTKKICNQKTSTSRKAWHKPQLSQTPTSATAFGGGGRADGKASMS